MARGYEECRSVVICSGSFSMMERGTTKEPLRGGHVYGDTEHGVDLAYAGIELSLAGAIRLSFPGSLA
jgi:hypothetical protein